MFSQVVKPFTTLVIGFLIGVSAVEIYHMETQPAANESCTSATKEPGNATSVMPFEKSDAIATHRT